MMFSRNSETSDDMIRNGNGCRTLQTCLLAFLPILGSASCGNERTAAPDGSTNIVAIDHVDYVPLPLLAEEDATPVAFDTATILGNLSPMDRSKLELLAGRVPVIGGVESVTVCWDEMAVAAKIMIGSRVIYCTKNANGNWGIVGMVIFADSTN